MAAPLTAVAARFETGTACAGVTIMANAATALSAYWTRLFMAGFPRSYAPGRDFPLWPSRLGQAWSDHGMTVMTRCSPLFEYLVGASQLQLRDPETITFPLNAGRDLSDAEVRG